MIRHRRLNNVNAEVQGHSLHVSVCMQEEHSHLDTVGQGHQVWDGKGCEELRHVQHRQAHERVKGLPLGPVLQQEAGGIGGQCFSQARQLQQ